MLLIAKINLSDLMLQNNFHHVFSNLNCLLYFYWEEYDLHNQVAKLAILSLIHYSLLLFFQLQSSVILSFLLHSILNLIFLNCFLLSHQGNHLQDLLLNHLHRHRCQFLLLSLFCLLYEKSWKLKDVSCSFLSFSFFQRCYEGLFDLSLLLFQLIFSKLYLLTFLTWRTLLQDHHHSKLFLLYLNPAEISSYTYY